LTLPMPQTSAEDPAGQRPTLAITVTAVAGSYCLSVAALTDLLQTAGFWDVDVQTVELDATWQSAWRSQGMTAVSRRAIRGLAVSKVRPWPSSWW
jgi:hypothetical protein